MLDGTIGTTVKQAFEMCPHVELILDILDGCTAVHEDDESIVVSFSIDNQFYVAANSFFFYFIEIRALK